MTDDEVKAWLSESVVADDWPELCSATLALIARLEAEVRAAKLAAYRECEAWAKGRAATLESINMHQGAMAAEDVASMIAAKIRALEGGDKPIRNDISAAPGQPTELDVARAAPSS